MPANQSPATVMGGTWEDSQSPAGASRLGVNAPDLNVFIGSIRALQYATNDEGHAGIQLTHKYIPGSNWRPHVHFALPITATPGQTVEWSFEYSAAPVNVMFSVASTLVATYTIVAEDVSGARPWHRILGFAEQSGAAQRESSLIMFRIYRSGGTSAIEPFQLSCDCHIQQGAFGTFDEYPSA